MVQERRIVSGGGFFTPLICYSLYEFTYWDIKLVGRGHARSCNIVCGSFSYGSVCGCGVGRGLQNRRR